MTQERHAQQGLPDLKLHDGENPKTRAGVVRSARLVALVVVLLLLAGLGRTLFARWSFGEALAARSQDNALTHVRVVTPDVAGKDARLTLPSTLQGVVEAQINARANGYVKQWFKDIGAVVKKGDVLATLDIPEVQRQVDEAQANYDLTRTAFERWTRLRAEDAVSQQELDEKTSANGQAKAVLQRMREQLAYGVVRAPFDGTVTKRNVNVGDLVNAAGGIGANSGSPQALFSMAQTYKLHAYVYVPQDNVPQVHVGDELALYRSDRPDQPIEGHVARTAGAIDPVSRTLQIDVEVANPKGELLPGTYVDAALSLKGSGALRVPDNALLFGAKGPQVAVVKDGKVLRKDVVLGTDFGRVIELKGGLDANDQVILNPSDTIETGQQVVVEASDAPAK